MPPYLTLFKKRRLSPLLILLFHALLFATVTNAQKKGRLEKNLTARCEERLFFKLYDQVDKELSPYDMIAEPDSSVIIVGHIRKFPLVDADLTDGLITRINKYGDILWSNAIDGPGTQILISVTQLADGNFAAFGVFEISTGIGFFLIKFDINGNLLWRKDYQNTGGGEYFGDVIIKEDADGSLIITSQFSENGLSFNYRLLFLKTNSSGDLLVSRSYKPPGIISYTHTNDMILKDGYSYTVGLYLDYGIITKIENSTGNLVWSKNYTFNGDEIEFLQIFPYSNNRFCVIAQNDINPTDTSVFFIIDTAGTCTSSKYLQFNTGWPRQYGSAAITSNYEIIWAMYYYRIPTDSTSFTLSKVHPENGIIYSNDYKEIKNFPIIYKTVISNDSSVYSTGFTGDFTGEYPLFLGKFSVNGTLGCPPVPIDAHFGSGTVQTVNLPMTTTNKVYPALPPISSIAPFSMTVDSICYITNFCDTLKIHGQDTLCDLQQSLQLTAFKNANCMTPISWSLNQQVVQTLQIINDTTVQIQFNQNWQGYLYAKITTPCGQLKDSIFITVLRSPSQVALGADSLICPNNTLLLNAHSGYSSYLWQNGSTDSTFTVTSPGTYWVQATDACNNIYRDTINISAALPIPFDIGPDVSKCNSDSINIVAPAGFINYSWSPNYNISNTNNQSVFVFPVIDTMYRVIAEKTPGCFVYDSLYVNVNTSPPIYLGADTSFCTGNSITLNAGSGFTNYIWNTGQSAATITVNSAGVYSVLATDNNNCKSKDTLRVLNVYANPVIGLPKDSLLCTGSSKNLNAGAGMSSYQWNTGANTSTISVNNIGTYWVNVIDNNGCTSADTTRITRLLALPEAFLPLDTVLCSYSILKISSSQAFSSYLWSTGSRQSGITVSQPGIYSLRVTDAFNCVGNDTIIINPKQCLEGIFVPNAFTPNKDGKNDIFRPLLFGVVSNMRFVIYNKWGQKVYETSKLYEGWDGKVSGQDAKTDVFVWTCEYQFEGQEKKFAKGTVILIR